ncbi:hypothetical protein [Bacillus sp. SG-1]|uniref:hypothetical protein n=1 Tax=Bacillus sp. SG-1 TaxID=161544 RepID=UPI0001544496|nr:hypothetical protein [Bacillus sp. SG-1]EDL66649.1 hypothetical protein BSG1_04815 [Bacillus sp. SG-1]
MLIEGDKHIKFSKERTVKDWTVFLAAALVIVGIALYYVVFFTPKDSLELYQTISTADDYKDVQSLVLEGYGENFKEKDYMFMKDTSANSVNQFTLFQYEEKSYLIMTTPGTERLKVLRVDELPEDIREYFLTLTR